MITVSAPHAVVESHWVAFAHPVEPEPPLTVKPVQPLLDVGEHETVVPQSTTEPVVMVLGVQRLSAACHPSVQYVAGAGSHWQHVTGVLNPSQS